MKIIDKNKFEALKKIYSNDVDVIDKDALTMPQQQAGMLYNNAVGFTGGASVLTANTQINILEFNFSKSGDNSTKYPQGRTILSVNMILKNLQNKLRNDDSESDKRLSR